ncbi:MAG: hypothetical protein DU429_00595 [Candidatus Tokpelaia sp.]|nr:MAG: hypothetical protein DU429_00595 [Candidatus Tokpelaia sp.]
MDSAARCAALSGALAPLKRKDPGSEASPCLLCIRRAGRLITGGGLIGSFAALPFECFRRCVLPLLPAAASRPFPAFFAAARPPAGNKLPAR